MNNHVYFFSKRFLFWLIRLKQEVALYDDKQKDTGIDLKVLHVGDADRGRDFIERLYGFLPERRIIGTYYAWPGKIYSNLSEIDCDIQMIEINRLFAEQYRQSGYFTLPEWVEFGRDVVKDPEKRYAGARKSLKCDLKRIKKLDVNVVITHEQKDFKVFYEKMYLSHLKERFGDTAIAKPVKKLEKDFLSGFLMLIKKGDDPIAGAIIRVNRDTVTETTIGVLDGAFNLVKMGASSVLDYHVHEWGSANNKKYINVGHTKPFPFDGIFFNKRKWMMSLIPDYDGVMDLALKICHGDDGIGKALQAYPFVYHNKKGLYMFGMCIDSVESGIDKVQPVWRRLWTEGLESLNIVSPTGYKDMVRERAKKLYGHRLRLFDSIDDVLTFHNGDSRR